MNDECQHRSAFELSEKDSAPVVPANDKKGRDTCKGRFHPAASENL
jgi:hypothetical protein